MIWRLSGRASFDELRRAGTRVSAGPLWCVGAPDGEGNPPRVAFAIGRPVGHAVTRNRLRRRLRAILVERGRLPSGAYLIGTRPEAALASYDELCSLMDSLLRRLSDRMR